MNHMAKLFAHIELSVLSVLTCICYDPGKENEGKKQNLLFDQRVLYSGRWQLPSSYDKATLSVMQQ